MLELEVDLETVLFYILLASWSLLPLRVGFLKPLLVGTKRHKLGLVKELVLRKFEKIEVFRITTTYCIKWFLSMNND